MAAIVRRDFAPLMAKAAAAMKVLFDEGVGGQVPLQQFRKIFNVEDSDGAYETEMGLVGFGAPALKRELEPVRFDAPQLGRPVTYVNNTYGLAVAISKEAADDDRTKKLVKIITPELIRNFKIEMETQAASIFGNAFSVQGYEPEKNPARPLVSNDHRLIRPSSLGSSVSNLISGALSYASLSAARALGRKNLTESGKKDPLVYKYLVVGPSLETQANTLMRSVNVPNAGVSASAPNDINDFKGSLEVVVLDYIPDDGRWFLLTEKSMHKLKWFDREEPNSDSDYDKKIRAMIFMTFARWCFGFSDWRGVLGSTGS